MMVRTGLDVLEEEGFSRLRGRRIAVICNQASVNKNYIHILDLFGSGHSQGRFQIAAVFGPQHGLAGTKQDNMIEWNGEGAETSRYPIYSLYGEHREPTDEMLAGVDLIVVDLPDVGSRYYTFIWTMALVMKAAERLGIAVLVLDRPNPIGRQVEGTVLEPEFSSFVGLHPLPLRHGMTICEIARLLKNRHYPLVFLTMVSGWNGTDFADRMEYAWVMPSPNMPTVQTAIVYPGGCLIEGTNLSEGRGTTKPFEMIGSPWLDGNDLAKSLNESRLSGVYFRPIQFEPTFNKYAGQVCNGVYVHVTDRNEFEPVLSYCALITEAIKQTGLHDSTHIRADRFIAAGEETTLPGFAWRQPPYEYEYEKMPIDILFGNSWMRPCLEQPTPLNRLRDRMKSQCEDFETLRKEALDS